MVCCAAGPATKPGEIFAFRGGGGLSGVAEKIAAPPMKLRWTYQTDEQQHASVESAATITADTVYVADDRGTLHAIDLATGKNKWKYSSDGGFDASPLVMDGRVYLGDLAGVFHCVSASDGKKIWTFDAESGVHGSANSDGSHIIFGTDGAQIICLDTGGKKLWSVTAEDRINAAPSIGTLPDGRMIALVSGCDSRLRAIDLKEGKEVFAAEMGALSPSSPVVVAMADSHAHPQPVATRNDRIIVGTDQGHVLCYSSDGKPLWDYDKVKDGAMVYASPAVSDGIVVTGARDRHVHAMSLADGKPLWTFATHGDVDSSPLISDGRVYIGSSDKKLYVLDLKTGAMLWQFTAGRAITAPPAIARGVLVIGDTRGNVYCFEGK
jgi:outer membrane protein assembly factor BamB